jgi:hypothetical protein
LSYVRFLRKRQESDISIFVFFFFSLLLARRELYRDPWGFSSSNAHLYCWRCSST